MTIKHIALSGGSQYGLSILGALYESEKLNIIDFNNIEKIYATSAGSICMVGWVLRIDKEDVYNFLINRPWEKVFKFETKLISSLFDKKGIINKQFVADILSPLLKTNSLREDITLKELYDYTKKDIHIIATKTNTLEHIDFNYKTYPDLPIIDAIYMSSTIPCIMQPIIYENTFIIDGAFSYNYPVDLCKKDTPQDVNSILGIKIVKKKDDEDDNNKDLLKYLFGIIEKMRDKINEKNETQAEIQINIYCESWLYSIKDSLFTKKKRQELIEDGERIMREYLENSVKKLI